MHDLQPVTLAYHHLSILGARHDLQIALYGDLRGVQAEPGQQLSHTDNVVDEVGFAVQGDVEGHRSVVSLKRRPQYKARIADLPGFPWPKKFNPNNRLSYPYMC